MAQTIKIAGATYSDVPAVKLGTPTAAHAWFFDAQAAIEADGDTGIVSAMLTWGLDTSGNIVPLPEGTYEYNALWTIDNNNNLVPRVGGN